MELKYKGSFKRDFKLSNRSIIREAHLVVLNVKKAKNISQIENLVKLEKYKTHYRIKVADDYRIGVIIRGNSVWFSRFGHRNTIYKHFP